MNPTNINISKYSSKKGKEKKENEKKERLTRFTESKIVKNNLSYWARLDKIASDTRTPLYDKDPIMAEALADGYRDDKFIIVLCAPSPAGKSNLICGGTVDKTVLLCYTKYEYAEQDPSWDYNPIVDTICAIRVRDFIKAVFSNNNVQGILFNRSFKEKSVIVTKAVLTEYINRVIS